MRCILFLDHNNTAFGAESASDQVIDEEEEKKRKISIITWRWKK